MTGMSDHTGQAGQAGYAGNAENADDVGHPAHAGPDPLKQLVLAELDGRRDELMDLCAALVAAPSVTPPGDTRGVADVLTDYLGAQGLDVDQISRDDDKPNLLARCEGRPGGRHLVWNGHMDTMEPGDESSWTVPVYELTRSAGRLYGLGMGNMKGAVAAMAVALGVLARHRDEWTGTLTVTFVSDEVCFGDAGSAHLLEARPDLAADGLLSGEGPGWMRLALAEKGMVWLRLSARDRGGHASGAQRGATAVVRLAAALVALDSLNDHVTSPPVDLAALLDGADTAGLRLSINAGTVAAGTVPNQIARHAEAVIDVRLPPGVTMADVDRLATDTVPASLRVEIETVKGWEANWTGVHDPLAQMVQRAATAVRGRPATAAVRLPASDASRWRALGVPAVCYGPQPTASAGVNDYAEEADVLDCAKIYALTVLDYCGASRAATAT